ncbi:MAG TPA: hypothetical protein P5243_06905 [Bacteroidales bacterium]|jgi:hypothetical protein|nr:hypothetical protein [Bacteroidales bacterium]HRS19214.1 hypothetical protein [Bacteroidales bacterium]
MNTGLQYQIFPDKKLIVEYYSGEIYKNTIQYFKKEISKNVAYNMHYNIIHDFRDATLVANIEEVRSFIDYIKQNTNTYAQKKIAFITNNPNQVSITYLFSTLKKETLLIAETFSTVEGAIMWVGLQPTETDFIQSVLEELKQLSQL